MAANAWKMPRRSRNRQRHGSGSDQSHPDDYRGREFSGVNVRLAINKVRKALGINHVSKLIAYMAVEQEHAWANLGIMVSQFIKQSGSGEGNGPGTLRPISYIMLTTK